MASCWHDQRKTEEVRDDVEFGRASGSATGRPVAFDAAWGGASHADRTQIILLSAEGETNSAIARRFGLSAPTVAHWRKRYQAHGQVDLYGEQRTGRPRLHDDERVAGLFNKVLQSRPRHATHWTVRHVATATGVPKSTAHRFIRLFGLQPHRSKSFKLSNDPFFVD